MDLIVQIISEIRAHPAAGQFLRFAMVGTLCFLVDTSVLYAALDLGANLYSGRAVSFLVAVTIGFFLNRYLTFQYDGPKRHHHQWAQYFALYCFSGSLNYGMYALLVATLAFVAATPVLGVAAGALTGMLFNFFGSRHLIFHDGDKA